MFRSTPADTVPPPPPETRRRALDNPRILFTVVGLLLAILVGLLWLPDRTSEFASPLVNEGVLYALWGVDLAILLALLFVLGRNLIKLFERRQAVPFARFRTKLVAAMLAMTIVPSLLVLV